MRRSSSSMTCLVRNVPTFVIALVFSLGIDRFNRALAGKTPISFDLRSRSLFVLRDQRSLYSLRGDGRALRRKRNKNKFRRKRRKRDRRKKPTWNGRGKEERGEDGGGSIDVEDSRFGATPSDSIKQKTETGEKYRSSDMDGAYNGLRWHKGEVDDESEQEERIFHEEDETEVYKGSVLVLEELHRREPHAAAEAAKQQESVFKEDVVGLRLGEPIIPTVQPAMSSPNVQTTSHTKHPSPNQTSGPTEISTNALSSKPMNLSSSKPTLPAEAMHVMHNQTFETNDVLFTDVLSEGKKMGLHATMPPTTPMDLPANDESGEEVLNYLETVVDLAPFTVLLSVNGEESNVLFSKGARPIIPPTENLLTDYFRTFSAGYEGDESFRGAQLKEVDLNVTSFRVLQRRNLRQVDRQAQRIQVAASFSGQAYYSDGSPPSRQDLATVTEQAFLLSRDDFLSKLNQGLAPKDVMSTQIVLDVAFVFDDVEVSDLDANLANKMIAPDGQEQVTRKGGRTAPVIVALLVLFGCGIIALGGICLAVRRKKDRKLRNAISSIRIRFGNYQEIVAKGDMETITFVSESEDGDRSVTSSDTKSMDELRIPSPIESAPDRFGSSRGKPVEPQNKQQPGVGGYQEGNAVAEVSQKHQDIVPQENAPLPDDFSFRDVALELTHESNCYKREGAPTTLPPSANKRDCQCLTKEDKGGEQGGVEVSLQEEVLVENPPRKAGTTTEGKVADPCSLSHYEKGQHHLFNCRRSSRQPAKKDHEPSSSARDSSRSRNDSSVGSNPGLLASITNGLFVTRRVSTSVRNVNDEYADADVRDSFNTRYRREDFQAPPEGMTTPETGRISSVEGGEEALPDGKSAGVMYL